ncbi:M20/M25/M40 family metallo-hydrolase [Cohnella sp. REN36]|uniref:M20/M25/M40 family metallo-hydrolase n=1 Tax=Cohnella sp. REN36 TaxID=2887347 RepID=UPI001D13B410|nr:M20/M25/M40 family metallo-hydrolase [Cohnella sp. REN36]MCC3372542.1 M28 family peptidase [Cohnella sp. REN36]
MPSSYPPSPYLPQPRSAAKRTWSRLARLCAILILLLGAMLAGWLQVRAPRPAGLDAPAEAFSAARAMTDLAEIAKEPHPIGSPAHDEVRDYLLARLEHLGLKPEVQRTEITPPWDPGLTATVENLAVRIPGTDSTKAVMIAAHYDSVSRGPGAADDGAAIAAMLETARALQASEPLRNDVILLMTDGEEPGLLGAAAFVRGHPWAEDVGLVLNFEARGNRGPSLMFETSQDNGWLVREFIKAAKEPLAYSLVYNVYKLMPNDTDLTVFRDGGLPGLNFAFGMGLNAYHQAIDTPERLDRASLQHHGNCMLDLTRHFGQADLNDVRQKDRVYFNVFGWRMLSYPESVSYWILLFGALLFAATLWHGMRGRRIGLKGIAGGLLASLAILGIVFAAVTLLWLAVRAIVPAAHYESIVKELGVGAFYLIGLLLLALAISALLVRRFTRRLRTEELWGGVLLLWLLLGAAATFFLPGGSYLFLWPLIFSLLGLNVSLVLREGDWTWPAVLSAMPGYLLFTPIVYLVFVMITLDAAGAVLTIAALAVTLIYPLFGRMPRRGWS